MANQNYARVTFNNTKLGRQIASINMPAGITCRSDVPCAKAGCYARKGRWLYKNVQNSLKDNLEAYKNDPKRFFESVAEQTFLCKFARWHSSGDIVDMEYLKGMCRVARKNKETKYLCFTKKFEIVNEYIKDGHKIPPNLKIVFSAWDDWIPDNPYNFPMTYVKGKNFDNSIIPESAIPCQGMCQKCQACWSLEKGQCVVFNKH